ncbi:MAG TPA: hypothetical protein VEB64_08470, partial [Azospirillaceae bacterium]|nr:hypothetical protein [Azospirillaceae bacterium]
KEQWRESAALIRAIPGCGEGTILVSPVEPRFFEIYFGKDRSGVLRSVDEVWGGRLAADAPFSQSCPVKLWAAHTNPMALSQLIRHLGWQGRDLEIRDFKQVYVVLDGASRGIIP